jgi:FkbM family methyltransferase
LVLTGNSHHVDELFYEQAQLLAHRDLIPIGSTVVDVGANVGNHALFYSTHTYARLIYVFEPNPIAQSLLGRNVAANRNRRGAIRTDHVRFAVGASAERLSIVPAPANNLGGAVCEPWTGGEAIGVDCVALDAVALQGPVRFLKIDVEGMEMAVLRGAEKLILNHRPAIAIEVQDSNETQFGRWLLTSGYMIVRVFVDYLSSRNFLLAASPR